MKIERKNMESEEFHPKRRVSIQHYSLVSRFSTWHFLGSTVCTKQLVVNGDGDLVSLTFFSGVSGGGPPIAVPHCLSINISFSVSM